MFSDKLLGFHLDFSSLEKSVCSCCYWQFTVHQAIVKLLTHPEQNKHMLISHTDVIAW